ncbi:hypothetical protein [Paraburkholderia strydomiana]|uniref:hypothetical protein n=1 Tax=Paraburkholderia strydomiana TaxID=1245417 RepID=UPI0038B8E95F
MPSIDRGNACEVTLRGNSLHARKEIPASPPRNLYVILNIVLAPADSESAKAAYSAMRQAFNSIRVRISVGDHRERDKYDDLFAKGRLSIKAASSPFLNCARRVGHRMRN